ncbi:MAG: T9SS type A sorting domain-containing protein [bacterium]
MRRKNRLYAIAGGIAFLSICWLAGLSLKSEINAAERIPFEITGDPAIWQKINAKALDPVYDTSEDAQCSADLMAFYFDQDRDRLSFRVTLFDAPDEKPRANLMSEDVSIFILMDYLPGGSKVLPGVEGISSPIGWELCIRINETNGMPLVMAYGEGLTELPDLARKSILSKKWGNLEASIWVPESFKEAVTLAYGKEFDKYDVIAAQAADAEDTPISFYVYSSCKGRIIDEIKASNQPYSNTHNVAFVHHLNQGLCYTNVFRGERGENASYDGDPDNPDDGADEILAAHDYYDLALNWHQGGLLISAAEWHDPSFNQWLATGVSQGRYEILTSALGQHIMPFLPDGLNSKAVNIETDMIETIYGYTPRVAWVPERVWVENPDNDGNGIDASAHVIDHIGNNFTENGVWAVILDDYVHCGYRHNPYDDHHIYVYSYSGGSIKLLPLDNDFVGKVNWDAGQAWNKILSGTSDEIIIYANDAEIVAEVMQGAGNTYALNNYIWLLQQCANNRSTVTVWKLTDVLQDPGFITQSITLQNGTYGLLGEFYGYGGGNNSWYGNWASYTGESNLDQHTPKWDYGTQWYSAYNKILGVPSNALREMAWYVLLTNLHETGWHDEGQISGWQHHYSNHIRFANAHAEAARWAAGLYSTPTGAYLSDFEDDGTEELVLYNDRLLAVFDPIGGKLQWLFCKGSDYAYSVVSNDNVYWADTDGDYNETNHIAALSDVSVGGIDREHDLYSFEVTSASGSTVSAKIIHPQVTKTVSLTLGDPYLKIQYRAKGQRVYVKNGFSPDILDLTWAGNVLERIWDPDGGTYFGHKNTNTNATAAVITGSAGARHNFQFSVTLLEGDELYGDSPFEVWLYGGYTSPKNPQGHIPELKALRDSLTDKMPPLPLNAIYYPATDHLKVYFDEAVNTATVVITGFGFDDDDDGIADVTLTSSDILTTTGYSKRLDFDLTPATASALESLSSPIELLLGANCVSDSIGNGNPVITNQDDIRLEMTPPTMIQIDGHLTSSEWENARGKVEDWWDSSWNGPSPGDTNEINVLYVDWDSTYLYIGILGHVQGNSWILYLDTDVGGPNGFTDLREIDHWERGAFFTATDFRVDYQYGAYQHQGPWDSHNLWRLLSSTSSVNISSQVLMAFDPQHSYGYEGGSELAIPWDVLYALGQGRVPPNTRIGLVASVCWDPEPNGELGGDSAPNNISATLPTIDNFLEVEIDSDGDGIPDPSCAGILERASGFRIDAFPNPARGEIRFQITLPGHPSQRSRVNMDLYDISGRKLGKIFEGNLTQVANQIIWDGRVNGRQLVGGIYLVTLRIEGGKQSQTKIIYLP